MRGVWTTERVRAAEERLMRRTRPGALMRRAAFGVSVQAARMLTEHAGRVTARRVVLLVGAGNNGGDALWAGAYLRRRGVRVTAVLLAPDRTHEEGLAALRRAGGRVVSAEAGPAVLAEADLVVDGIVGLSARGGLRAEAAELVAAVDAPVLAVDLPSGVDPDTGQVHGVAVRADVTVTFGAHKPVHVLNPARCGDVRFVDIGLAGELGEPDLRVAEAADAAEVWPIPAAHDNKYTQGVTGVAAGSSTYAGAAVLTTGAAVRSTAGMVRFAGSAAESVRARWPEVIATGTVTDAGRVQSWVVGPGLGTGTDGRETVRAVLSAGVPVCADADAVNLLAGTPELLDARDPDTPLVLTPHAREFERLVGADPGHDRVAAARAAARRFSAVVLLKGHNTVVADPDGRVLVTVPRGSWLATAGSGDVLSGMIGALLAAGTPPWTAAGVGAYVHAEAAALAARGAPISSSDVLDAIPDAVRSVRAVRPAGERV
ncbi:NAD(P)H-hydrate dehydratase [Haloechinothrix sp. YIM 98757]|uniref:Bifunctional NAD(P)H-hydrate repair enzyme n=1 Tax=Haloechinothrix aidingensis TaxID=2752311 RepID=A0A838A0X4_9PSEU|nr:NAD(P)H-hydrate dehydratase [Haloechinothrix aidingensis]MBA0124773.1 NAD(P)H-hydrate dehydratase [Haloechinothrix aidingensis]